MSASSRRKRKTRRPGSVRYSRPWNAPIAARISQTAGPDLFVTHSDTEVLIELYQGRILRDAFARDLPSRSLGKTKHGFEAPRIDAFRTRPRRYATERTGAIVRHKSLVTIVEGTYSVAIAAGVRLAARKGSSTWLHLRAF